MLIRDLSSDVCSSDLVEEHRAVGGDEDILGADVAVHQRDLARRQIIRERAQDGRQLGVAIGDMEQEGIDAQRTEHCIGREGRAVSGAVRRSEEHTSELQSLMRISYAVFCLKKKK